MIYWILILGWIWFSVAVLGSIAFIVTSIHERKWRAVRVAVLLFAPVLGLFVILLLQDFPAQQWIVLGLFALSTAGVLILTLPLGSNPRLNIPGTQKKIDERDALFHRFYRIEPGTPEYESYYRQHPEKLEFDDKVRALPQLGLPGSKTYHPLASIFQKTTFEVIRQTTREIDWEPAPLETAPIQAPPEEFSSRIKGFARYVGADLVCTTKLNPAYVYSHIGRSPGKWGAPITLNHTHAIAIGVEMDYSMIRHAPDIASTTETAYQYLEAAKIAMLVARYINRLGYEARAHIDANYRVMCVPIAVDAGLGELGRLGLLITPEFGPRLRLSIVTTDLPLNPDEPITFGVQDFCNFCKKCATNCPSGSIPSGDKSTYNGVEKWQIEQESCYRFWRMNGSDCSICIKVCPYSHPKTPFHESVRWAIRRNKLARRLALFGDDLFYGRRPKTRFPLPDWHDTT